MWASHCFEAIAQCHSLLVIHAQYHQFCLSCQCHHIFHDFSQSQCATIKQCALFVDSCGVPTVSHLWIWVLNEVPACHPTVCFIIPDRPRVQSMGHRCSTVNTLVLEGKMTCKGILLALERLDFFLIKVVTFTIIERSCSTHALSWFVMCNRTTECLL